jgi:hypothetical protein
MYVVPADDVESLLLKVFQSVDERVPVALVPASASVRAWPEIVRPFILLVRVTSPEFEPVEVPEKFDADIFPVNTAPANFAYVVDAVVVDKYAPKDEIVAKVFVA